MKQPKRLFFYICLSILIFHSTGLAARFGHEYTLSGRTMGTFYTIKFITPKNTSLSLLQARVDNRLEEINKRLSMFDTQSELSVFNSQKSGTLINVSADFYDTLLTAKKLYDLTEGAWDGTVKPLVDLWGFGTAKNTHTIPDASQIALALSKTGFHHIDIKGHHTLLKTADITLDLGSIAKGYAVDALAHLFTSSGITDVLVEIGGELYGAGTNKKGEPWSVGISEPDKQFSNHTLFNIIRLNNHAIATSGNYRNFFDIKGKTYSHIIDPKTGFPVDNAIVSASVISKDCTFADGLATALMVMDVQKAIALVNRLEDTECLIIQKKMTKFISHTSDNFDRFVVK